MNNSLMLAGLVAGLLLGLAASITGNPTLLGFALGVEPLGEVFIRVLQMVVIPLVMALVFSAVAGLGNLRRLGRVGGTALLFIWSTTVVAVLMGMGAMQMALTLFRPAVSPEPLEVQPVALPGVVDFLVQLVPANPFAAAADGRLLPLLVFSVLFGAAAGVIEAPARERLTGLADAVSGAFIRLVLWILVAAPLGIFGLAAPAAARMGVGLLQSLAVLVGTVIVTLGLFVALVYLPAVRWIGGVKPGAFVRHTLPSFTMGFTTTSGMPTLPVLLRDAPALGISPPVRSLVIPLGVSLNRAGSALFQGGAVVFSAFLFGVEVPGGAWVGAVIATFFAAATVAPVPSSGVFTLAPALSAVGAPLEAMGILLAVDRVPDMFRSGVNMTGHMAAAVVTDALVGEGTADPESGWAKPMDGGESGGGGALRGGGIPHRGGAGGGDPARAPAASDRGD